MSRVIICDRCKAVIPPGGKIGKISLTWTITANGDPDPEERNPYDALDFCEVCMDSIREMIEDEPKKPKAAEPVKMRGSRIDAGKIMALWKTGTWTLEKIAEECKCSVTTVQRVIKEENKKK